MKVERDRDEGETTEGRERETEEKGTTKREKGGGMEGEREIKDLGILFREITFKVKALKSTRLKLGQ